MVQDIVICDAQGHARQNTKGDAREQRESQSPAECAAEDAGRSGRSESETHPVCRCAGHQLVIH